MARNAPKGNRSEVRGEPTRRRFIALLLTLVLPAAAVVAIAPAAPAQALDGSEFNPEYIISDELFYDGSAMTAAQIQSFLDSKIGTCLSDRCLNVAVVPVTSQASTYSTRNGALLCGPIEGGNLRVSELIYRTQVACGISAKAILVTLHKEQSLITEKNPTDRQLRAAMGMGCPDTAPCSDAFAGFVNQVISGTRQLVTYRNGNFSRQPGLQYIQYNPNASCGGSYLQIRNYATAALYNYTPYQPNASALANLTGKGDDCGSYGNRNFWYLYNQWFGPTTTPVCTTNPTRDITRYWEDLGGSSSIFGDPVSPGVIAGDAGTTLGFYANGLIYCTPRVGAYGVVGDIQAKYSAMGGPASSLGAPISTQTPWSAGGVTGLLQEFQRGTILSSATSGTYAVLHGTIRTVWGNHGGSAGSIGWPIGDQEAIAGGVRQRFQYAVIVAPNGQSAVVMTGEIGLFWGTGSNASALGAPSSTVTSWTAGGVTGVLQYFQKGMVLSSDQTGTHAVLDGPVRNAWGNLGGTAGTLGWPISELVPAGSGYRQDFQGGTIIAPATGGAYAMAGDIAAYWSDSANAARLGTPIGSSTPWTANGISGYLQYFQNGLVMSSTTTGTVSVLNGAMRDQWAAQAGSNGPLGWPVADQVPVSGGVQQQFQGGWLTTAGSGLAGEMAAYAAVHAAALGPAKGAATTWAAGGITGMLQYFQKGMVLSSTSTGTFAVLDGPMRDMWGAQGGSGGALGWPTGSQQTINGVTTQQFQYGQLSTASSGPAADIAAYVGTGSNASLLGASKGAATAWTAGGVSGMIQYFAKGMVLSSATTGTYAVLDGPMRERWGAQGGSGGSLGWPTGDQKTLNGITTQQFQGGVISTAGSGPAADIAAYVATGPNASLLGASKGAATAWTAGGVSGMIQHFAKGMVLSSATTGTYAVFDGPLRNAWGNLGGSGGTMGWPTGDQIVVSGGIRQDFQHGSITVTTDGKAIGLTGEYATYWANSPIAVLLGNPQPPVVPLTAGGITGSYLQFQRGMVLSSTETGTWAVLDGPMRSFWGSLGGTQGSLGWPTGDQQLVDGGLTQEFQHGTVMVPTTGAPYILP